METIVSQMFLQIKTTFPHKSRCSLSPKSSANSFLSVFIKDDKDFGHDLFYLLHLSLLWRCDVIRNLLAACFFLCS